jgi:hypothetical protein
MGRVRMRSAMTHTVPPRIRIYEWWQLFSGRGNGTLNFQIDHLHDVAEA